MIHSSLFRPPNHPASGLVWHFAAPCSHPTADGSKDAPTPIKAPPLLSPSPYRAEGHNRAARTSSYPRSQAEAWRSATAPPQKLVGCGAHWLAAELICAVGLTLLPECGNLPGNWPDARIRNGKVAGIEFLNLPNPPVRTYILKLDGALQGPGRAKRRSEKPFPPGGARTPRIDCHAANCLISGEQRSAERISTTMLTCRRIGLPDDTQPPLDGKDARR